MTAQPADPELVARYKARVEREADLRRTKYANYDMPEQKAAVARGLANLYDWMGKCARPYHGPWPTSDELKSDDWYANFQTRPDVVEALRKRIIPKPLPPRAPVVDEPPLPTAEPDGPDFDADPQRAVMANG